MIHRYLQKPDSVFNPSATGREAPSLKGPVARIINSVKITPAITMRSFKAKANQKPSAQGGNASLG